MLGELLNAFAGMFGGIEPMIPRLKPLLLALAEHATIEVCLGLK